jgi:hypothetical protein
VSIYVHRERVGGARPDSADPAPAETTQPALAPQSATHPRDLEQEMIEHENQTHAVQQAQSLQQVEGMKQHTWNMWSEEEKFKKTTIEAQDCTTYRSMTSQNGAEDPKRTCSDFTKF